MMEGEKTGCFRRRTPAPRRNGARKGSASLPLPRKKPPLPLPIHLNSYESEDDMLKIRQIRCCPCSCVLIGRQQKTVLDLPKSFFRLPNFPGSNQASDNTVGHRKKEYAERRLLGWDQEQMYDIVSDVDKYQNFVPWCTRSKVTYRRAGMCRADLEIGFPPVVERYSSNITLERPQLVKSVATEGKLFNNLVTTWRFSPGSETNARTCSLDYSVSFEFRSSLHAHLAHMFFDEVINAMVKSFLKRAEKEYGPPSIPHHRMRPKVIQRKS